MSLKSILSFLITLIFLTSCDENKAIPDETFELSTEPIKSITFASAVSGGTIISFGDGVILQKGVCWSITPQPTVTDKVTGEGVGADSFTSVLTDLMANADYYVRSYVITETGKIRYGDELLFKTGICVEPDSIGHPTGVCDEEFITSHPGTACCISGPGKAIPGEIMTFQLVSNMPNADITWIVSSSITIMSGQNNTIANMKFADDFTGGCLGVRAYEDGRGCQITHWISSQ